MAKRKQLTKKVKALLRTDVLVSIALTSVLLNVFFFSGVYLFQKTNNLDEWMYRVSYNNLCTENYTENLVERMEESTAPEVAKVRFEALCNTGDFERYFDSIFEAYLADQLGE